jgi:hypothetical protein
MARTPPLVVVSQLLMCEIKGVRTRKDLQDTDLVVDLTTQREVAKQYFTGFATNETIVVHIFNFQFRWATRIRDFRGYVRVWVVDAHLYDRN